MRSSHPSVFLDICKKEGFDQTQTLALLLVAKKLFDRYGFMISDKRTLDAIYQSDKDAGSILAILYSFGIKTSQGVTDLINRIQAVAKEYYGTVEFSDKEHETTLLDNVQNVLNSNDQHVDVLLEKHMNVPGIHIATHTHRYHRDLDTDLDTLLPLS